MAARIAYIQLGRRGYDGPSFETANGYSAWRGFADRGVETKIFRAEYLHVGSVKPATDAVV